MYISLLLLRAMGRIVSDWEQQHGTVKHTENHIIKVSYCWKRAFITHFWNFWVNAYWSGISIDSPSYWVLGTENIFGHNTVHLLICDSPLTISHSALIAVLKSKHFGTASNTVSSPVEDNNILFIVQKHNRQYTVMLHNAPGVNNYFWDKNTWKLSENMLVKGLWRLSTANSVCVPFSFNTFVYEGETFWTMCVINWRASSFGKNRYTDFVRERLNWSRWSLYTFLWGTFS